MIIRVRVLYTCLAYNQQNCTALLSSMSNIILETLPANSGEVQKEEGIIETAEMENANEDLGIII